MKILAVVGSKRSGNTQYIVENIISTIEKNVNLEIDTIHLSEFNIHFCNGCLTCDETSECVLEDDMSKIMNSVKNADGFIFASPARWGLLSGELKTFFDRLNPLAMGEELNNKLAVIITVGQSTEEEIESIESAAKSIEMFCENAGIKVIDVVTLCGCYGADDAKNKKIDLKNGIIALEKMNDYYKK